MPASKLMTPTTTGTHTGMEEEHKGRRMVGEGLGLQVVSVYGAVVVMVTGGLGRLLILVKMKGFAFEKENKRKEDWLSDRGEPPLLTMLFQRAMAISAWARSLKWKQSTEKKLGSASPI